MRNLKKVKSYVRFYAYLVCIAVAVCGFIVIITSNDMSDMFYITLLTGGAMLILGSVGAYILNYPVSFIAFVVCIICASVYYANKIFHIRFKRYRKCRYVYLKYDKSFSRLYKSAYNAIKCNCDVFRIYHS